MRAGLTLMLLSALILPGCAEELLEDDGEAQSFLVDDEDAPEAQGALWAANALSFAELRQRARVTAGAAEAIVRVRAGEDGLLETPDDHPFASLQALDAVPFVGPRTFAKLVSYAGIER